MPRSAWKPLLLFGALALLSLLVALTWRYLLVAGVVLAGARLVAHQAGWRPKARLQGWLGLFLLARIAKTYERSLAQAMPPLPPAPRESGPPAPEISREPLPLRDERGTLPDNL